MKYNVSHTDGYYNVSHTDGYYNVSEITPESDGYVSQYQSVYDSFATKPSSSVADAQNILVKSLVDSGVWIKLDLFYMFAQESNGGSEALVNWVDPGTYDAVEVANGGALTFTSLQGIKGDGKAYLRTNYTPRTHGTNYTKNNACMGVYVRAISVSGDWDMGCNSGTNETTYISCNSGSLFTRVYINANYSSATVTQAAGLKVHDRATADNFYMYLNGIRYSPAAARPAVDTPNSELYIFAINNGGPAGMSSRELSCAFVGGSLTEAKQTDIFNAVENYLTT